MQDMNVAKAVMWTARWMVTHTSWPDKKLGALQTSQLSGLSCELLLLRMVLRDDERFPTSMRATVCP